MPPRAEHIVDLGIFKGGSVAFYHQLFLPRRSSTDRADRPLLIGGGYREGGE